MADPVHTTFRCTLCNKDHHIELPADMAEGRESFPFSYVFLHKLESKDSNIDEIGIDILTTLYIDANMKIRGVETKKLTSGDIISKDDSKNIITNLMEEMGRLQDAYNELEKNYKDLKEKYDALTR